MQQVVSKPVIDTIWHNRQYSIGDKDPGGITILLSSFGGDAV